jgi:uncharacterized membrane protein YhaH (DUF805 family)
MTERGTSLDTSAQGIGTDLAGVFDFLIDPRGAARRLPRKFFWIAPLVITSMVILVVGIINTPLVHQAMMNQPPPPNVSPEQFQQRMNAGFAIQKVFIYLSPLVLVVITALSALIVLVCCMVLDLKPKFLELFNLMAGLSIIAVLKVIASTIVLHMKGEPSSMADLQPALGLDIFAPMGTNKMLVALLAFFNIFDLWQIVMAILIFAAAYRVSKGKATAAILPVFLVGLVLRLIGAFFNPNS